MSKPIIAVAPGKIILHGEHAVVYQKKAIACAINGTVQVQLNALQNAEVINISVPNLQLDDGNPSTYEVKVQALHDLYHDCLGKSGAASKHSEKWHPEIKLFASSICKIEKENHKLRVVTAISALIFAYFVIVIEEGNLPFPCFCVEVNSNNLPFGAGLGSSAAYNVSLATVFLLFCNRITPLENSGFRKGYAFNEASLALICEKAFEMEKVVHGTPSGIDNSVSTFGGALVYENGVASHLSRFPKLNLLVVDSGVSRNTKALVSDVKAKSEQFPAIMKFAMNSIHEVSVAAEQLYMEMSRCNDEASLNRFHSSLKDLVCMNQHLLNCIGVGHPKLDEIFRIASDGGFACKLTGAGGGGCAIILLDDTCTTEKVDNLQKALEAHSFSSWQAVLGCNGVEILSI